MANNINRQVIMNDSHNYVVKYTVIADGSGDLTNSIIQGTSGDVPATGKIKLIKSTLAGFRGYLQWDATTKVPCLSLGQDVNLEQDFREIGGLPNQGGAGVTGNVLLNTTGMSTSGYSGTILLWMLKS